MKHSDTLRKLFKGTELCAGDLLLLESFQVSYLPGRIPEKHFAPLMRSYPRIKEFLELKDASIRTYIEAVLVANEEIPDEELNSSYCDEAVWEVADLIVYNKYPELYDELVPFNWEIDEIIDKEALKGKVVADVGAGTGALAFLLAEYAETVFAVEPVSSFRTFMKQKAARNGIANLFVLDGILDSIQLPENSLDMLFTSNSIGWNIEEELQEIERVVKSNGMACHIFRMQEKLDESPLHEILVSDTWKYKFSATSDKNCIKVKYEKTIL
jgi:SAM-dependent methyltransferase